MKITVVIPTYRRPQDLKRCLEALNQQTRPADEVLVIVRDSDTETWELLKASNLNSLPLRAITVTIPGQVAALNTGIKAAQGDIISITDDDAAPHPEWLERIEGHFKASEHIGGVGGRDWMYLDNVLQDASFHPGASQVVGKVQWTGRTIGNHHIGEGKARNVDILKGANMSYRRSAIANISFDTRLLGTGAQVHNDMAFSLNVRRAGWKLIYDPLVAVDHYPAQRFDEDQRHNFNKIACINAVHNETLTLLEYLSPFKRIVFIIWALLIGTRDSFGALQWLRFTTSERGLAWKKLVASWQGRWQGWLTWQNKSQSNQDIIFDNHSGLAEITRLTTGDVE